MTKPRVLIMAGGTGGHIFPAQAVASELQQAGWQIHWLGSAGKMEATLVPGFGWPFHPVTVSGLRGKGLLALVKAPFMLLNSVLQARAVIKDIQPQLVLGFGGYASGPGGLAAWLQRIPLLIHEQNAVAGSTNRLLARFARKVLVAFPAAFAGHVRQLLVGNPVRKPLIGVAERHEFSGCLKVLVIGGSQGAKVLNETLPPVFSALAEAAPIQVRHQTGKAMLQQTQQQYQQLANANLEVEASAFIDDMAQAYAWADLVICRAGASTVSELACAGVAAVFVPLPSAIDDHQTANAKWLSERGGALLIPQSEFTAASVQSLLARWQQDKTELQQMAAIARACALDDASARVVAQCLQAVSQQGQQL